MSHQSTKAIVIFATLWFAAASAVADWTYRSGINSIGGQSGKVAEIRSSKSLNLKFPYNGSNFGSIIVRPRPGQDPSVTFSVDMGQLTCDSYSGCSINLRFDDGPPVEFSARGSTGFGSNQLHFKNESRFVALASRASRIYVQVSMYQAGRQTLEFRSVMPLAWDSRKVTEPLRPNVWEPRRPFDPLRSH